MLSIDNASLPAYYRDVMKNKSSGRTAETVSVSVAPGKSSEINERVKGLGPRVSSRSHYVQLLIELDLKNRILDGIFRKDFERAGSRRPSQHLESVAA